MTIKLGTIDLAGLGSSNSDNISITQNSSNKLQTIGIINQNDTTEAFKTWVGTTAEYEALETKSNDTIYHITDDEKNNFQDMLEIMYPIGAIYIGTMNICPLSALFGTWEKVSSGRVLQGADANHAAGTTIEAGLPNITGTGIFAASGQQSTGTGAFTKMVSGTAIAGSSVGTYYKPYMDASDSNSIYGNSNTVQPSAFVVNIWRRTA